MSTDTTQAATTPLAAEDALRQEIADTLLKAIDAKPDDLDDKDRQELAKVTAALMRVFARHQQPAVWTVPLAQDAVSNVTASLQLGGVPADRKRVAEALAAAGIEPGEVR